MKNSKILFLSILAALLFFVSCEDDNPVSVNESKVLVEYLESSGEPVINTFGQMTTADAVNAEVLVGSTNMYIIDIRSAADFAAGHIEGAHNVVANDVLSHYETNNLDTYETVVVCCYSGQTAAWVTSLLHTMGYTNVKDMLWGMCSWNSTTASAWPNGIGNTYATSLVTTATAKGEVVDLPTLNTGKTNPEDILRARVEAVFAEGFGEAKVTASTVLGAPTNYYIVNYWPETDYNWGHIPGAVQYTPKESLTSDTFLKTLPTDKTIAVYCYTGQTSAHIAAYLRVLGYDAKSIVYGMNGMSYDNMSAHKWSDTAIHDYTLVQ